MKFLLAIALTSSFSALLVATAAVARPVGSLPPQFDLICSVKGRVVADPHPDYVGTNMLKRWKDDWREPIDLRRMLYCEEPSCHIGLERIETVTSNRLTFIKERGFSVTLDVPKLHYILVNTFGERVERTEGYCRLAKFSGFPTDKMFVPLNKR